MKIIVKRHNHIQETLDGEQLEVKIIKNGNNYTVDSYQTTKSIRRSVLE